jgi:flagellar basal-body rod modification protein FlgD
MQNQDPTADTDPNEYINQLVQVNSLEQLIDINQNVSTALGDTSATTTSGSAPKSGTTNQAQNAASMTNTASSAANSVAQTQPASSAHTAAMATAARSAAANVAAAMQGSGAKSIPGNLSIPSATAASRKVAEALNGRPRVQ